MSEIQTISVVVAAASVAAFVVNSILTSRREEKRSQQTLETRQAQLFMGIYQALYNESFQESAIESLYMKFRDLNDYISLVEDPKRAAKFGVYGMWLEGQGVLVKEGLIDVKIVAELSGGLIIMWWNNFGPYILGYRKLNNPRHMVEAEYLVRKVAEYGMEHPELMIPQPQVSVSQ